MKLPNNRLEIACACSKLAVLLANTHTQCTWDASSTFEMNKKNAKVSCLAAKTKVNAAAAKICIASTTKNVAALIILFWHRWRSSSLSVGIDTGRRNC
jgi:hypothetical protein